MLMREEGFCSTKHEMSIRQNDLRESSEEVFFKILLEVNGDISAEH